MGLRVSVGFRLGAALCVGATGVGGETPGRWGRFGGEAEGAKALTVTYGYVRVLRVGGERRAAALAIIADGY